MSDVTQIPPKRARLALSAGLRKMADAVDAGEVHWVSAMALYTQPAAEARGHAFGQLAGWPQQGGAPYWMMALGALRSSYLDFEEQILEVGASTITDPKTYTT